MLQLRLAVPADLTDDAVGVLASEPSLSSLAVVRGASLEPQGDLVYADVAREHANPVITRLRELGVAQRGTIVVQPVDTWLSKAALDAQVEAEGNGADTVVWAEVGSRAYEDSELNWAYGVFMLLATMIAAIAIVLDSQILVIGAMVLGPEFGPIAALALALVLRRPGLFTVALRALLVGFTVSIGLTALMALVARWAGWIAPQTVLGPRPATSFIYHPNGWSFVVAVLAAIAGVMSLTSGRVGGLSGVFISVTTVPAAGNIALGLAFWSPDEVLGSAAQLGINLSAMVLAGWLTLLVQRVLLDRLPVNPWRRDMWQRRSRDVMRPS